MSYSINHSVLPKGRSFTANLAFSTLPLLSLPLHILIHSIYHVVDHLISSSAASFLPFIIPSRSSFSRHFLFSQCPSQFLFLFFISSSIILPSPTLSSTTAFLFCMSILHTPSFSISTSQMLPVVFAHSVVVFKFLHHTTLHSTKSTPQVSSFSSFFQGSAENASLSVKSFFCCPLLYFLTAVHVASDITPQVFEAVHLFDRFIFNSYMYLLWLSSN